MFWGAQSRRLLWPGCKYDKGRTGSAERGPASGTAGLPAHPWLEEGSDSQVLPAGAHLTRLQPHPQLLPSHAQHCPLVATGGGSARRRTWPAGSQRLPSLFTKTSDVMCTANRRQALGVHKDTPVCAHAAQFPTGGSKVRTANLRVSFCLSRRRRAPFPSSGSAQIPQPHSSP